MDGDGSMAWHLNPAEVGRDSWYTREPPLAAWGISAVSTEVFCAALGPARARWTAVHEAAHVVMYARAGVRVRSVEIFPAGRELPGLIAGGCTDPEPFSSMWPVRLRTTRWAGEA
jgi:hypothetical protein